MPTLKLGYSNSTLRMGSRAIELMEEMKVAHLEVRVDNIEHSSLIYQDKYCWELSQLRRTLGVTLSVHSVAGINLAEKVGRIRQCCIDLLVEQMEFCDRVGAEWLTIHAGTCGFSAGNPKKPTRLRLAVDALNEVLYRTGSRVKIGVENQERLPVGAGKTYIGDCFEELDILMRLLPERAGFIFDSGHANLNPKCEASLLLERMCNRLIGLHLHVNEGDYDRHGPLTKAWIANHEGMYRLILKLGACGYPLIVEHHNLHWARMSLRTLALASQSATSRT